MVFIDANKTIFMKDDNPALIHLFYLVTSKALLYKARY